MGVRRSPDRRTVIHVLILQLFRLGLSTMESKETKAEDQKSEDDLLPVSLLCGFLGAGKTTLMKHILETKHEEKDFRCAIIVNDMAALNIDKNLIDQSALVQSDEVIAMQNGCFCCTLQSDLVDQIISLCEKKILMIPRLIMTMMVNLNLEKLPDWTLVSLWST